MPNFVDIKLDDWKEQYEVHPDGQFITTASKQAGRVCRTVTETIFNSIKNINHNDLPRLIIAFGKCRVGSTALTNAVGRSGMASYFQPFKSILRQTLCDEHDPSHLEGVWSQKTVFCKEMFGPYTEFESRWNPFQSLIELGYPPSKLTLVWLERDPIDSLISWRRYWSPVVAQDTLLRHFQMASRTANQVATDFTAYGARVLRFNYESLRSNPDAIFHLLDAIDVIPIQRSKVVEWGAGGDLSSEKSSIIFTKEPEVYGAVKVHSNRSKFDYVPQVKEPLDEQATEAIFAADLYRIFEEHRTNCVAGSKVLVPANSGAEG
ncbi:MAG: hypothetical protein VX111_06660 [Planctomycetota bacterium]|nr:hypothetical protein [Planctomycetota bacterium]